MHERTFIMSMLALDMMIVVGGGIMAWIRALPRKPFADASLTTSAASVDPITAVMTTLMIAVIGGWIMYVVNQWVFQLAESPDPDRPAGRAAMAFIAAVLLGGLAGMFAGK
jgi:hypothetical protein